MVAVNYLWNPLNDNIAREFDDAGATVAEYTTEPDEFGNVVSQRREATDSYFHYDGTGSTLALTSQAGSVTDTLDYTAFGETTDQWGSAVIAFQYVGQNGYYRDTEVGEHLVRRRVLSSAHARWLSQDPVFAYLILIHFYCYANNSPVTGIDPSGLCPRATAP